VDVAARVQSRTELTAAFEAFNAASGQLSGAFEALQARVVQLTVELAEVRAVRAKESAERERLSLRLQALLDALPGGVLVLDAERRICECNPAAKELLGGDLLGLTFEDALSRATASTGGRSELPQTELELVSGRIINIARRIFGAGSEAGDVVLLADMTESHLLRSLMARQQRLATLGELAATLAHQIRTPLSAALLYASQMNLPNRSVDDLRRCAMQTRERLNELDKLIHDMLAFARGGGATETVDLNALLEQVAQWLTPALERGATITLRTLAPGLTVRGSAASLVGAVLNLATNALQARPKDARLILLVRRGGAGRAEIVVADNGPGVPARLRERIFDPFFTTRERGTGLGLAIVRSVTEAHRGSVRLEESAAGGASFVIDLPLESAK
jgi:two-component system, sensor histidine kinase FlrB